MPTIPGLLQAFRSQGQTRITIANPTDQTWAILRSMQASSIEEVPLSLEDAFISHLADRGEKSFFLQGLSHERTETVGGAA